MSSIRIRTVLLRGWVKFIWTPLCIKVWYLWTETPIWWWFVTRSFSTCLILERWELMFLIIGCTKRASPLRVIHHRKRASPIILTILQEPQWRKTLFLHPHFPSKLKWVFRVQTKIGESGFNRRFVGWRWRKIGEEWSWMMSKQWCNYSCCGSHLPSEALVSLIHLACTKTLRTIFLCSCFFISFSYFYFICFKRTLFRSFSQNKIVQFFSW